MSREGEIFAACEDKQRARDYNILLIKQDLKLRLGKPGFSLTEIGKFQMLKSTLT